MNKLMYIPVAAIFMVACSDNSKQTQQLQTLHAQDSILTGQLQQKDSSIVSYVKTLDEIQNNIDSIKSKEHLLTVGAGGEPPHNIISDIKRLDAKVVWENRRIYQLEKKLKRDDKKDADLEKLVKHLTKELAEKDAQIGDLQAKLAASNTSLKTVTEQFNDSIAVIHKQREEINAMRLTVNTVYYNYGNLKALKKQGIVTKEGSIIGIGGATELKSDFNTSNFTEGDLTKLQNIPLSGKFAKFVTNHPEGSYKVFGNKNIDTVYITDPASFWSKSKYLVIITK